MYPADLKYTKEHEWIKVEGNTGRVGITHHAQNALGDVVFVELPKVGDHVTANEAFGTIESVKAVSEIFAPVDGEVVGINPKLQNSPELVNTDPHGDAWLVRVKLSNRADTEKLMTAEDYEAYLQKEKKAE